VGPDRTLRCSEYDNNLNTNFNTTKMRRFEDIIVGSGLILFVLGAGEVINWIINTIIG